MLRGGLAISLVLETAGVAQNYLQTGDSSLALSPSWLAGGTDFFSFAWSSLVSVTSGSPTALISLGIAVLMLTPYARVVASVVYYVVERDWRFTGITLLVLSIITVGLLLL